MESERFIYWNCSGSVRDTVAREFTDPLCWSSNLERSNARKGTDLQENDQMDLRLVLQDDYLPL